MDNKLPIFLRAHTEIPEQRRKGKAQRRSSGTTKRSRLSEPKWPEYVLVFDTETTMDERQSLTFGAYRYCRLGATGVYECTEEGLFCADDLEQTDPEGFAALREYVDNARAEAVEGYPCTLQLRSRAECVERVFWRALEAGAAVVAFNLPFDLTRIAADCTKAKKRNEGWSLVMSMDRHPDTGILRANPLQYRVVITPKDSKAAFMRLAGCGVRSKKTGKRLKPYIAGRFLDLRTLGWALRSKPFTLESACRDYGVSGKLDHDPTGGVTFEEIEYCREDVRATTRLLNAMRAEFDLHPVDLYPEKALSPASIAKAYMREMGIVPPVEKFKFPSWVHGIAMEAYYGGRAECRIRHTEVPVLHTDFMSEYPTANIGMGLWQLLRAGSWRIEDVTAEVRALLQGISLDSTFDPAFWPQLTFFAQIRPMGTILPVRTEYNGETSNIGINPLTSSKAIWYAGPDLVAATLLGGEAPEVVRAIRIVPEGQQSGLKPVALRGMIDVDPRKDDFYKVLIESRARVKKMDPALAYFLKILANAGSYGLFVEVNPERTGERRRVRVFSGDAEYETSSPVVEPPGKWYCPALGALITAAGRLLLAQLECSVRELGGTYLFCDTDSLAIVASETGGLVPCEGGAEILPDGRAAVKALTWAEVEGIQRKFERLNPYDRAAVSDPILKIEDVNYRDGVRQQLFGWAISAKRYVLYRRTPDGGIEIVKASAHGLGFLYHPRPKGDFGKEVPAWVLETWDWIIRGALDLPRIDPSWFELPAMMKVAITTPNVLKSLQTRQKGKRYQDRAKPFNFLLVPILDSISGCPDDADRKHFTLITPFTADTSQWHRRPYLNIHDEKQYRLAPLNRKKTYEAAATPRCDYIYQYVEHPEAKSLAPGGEACKPDTRGLLQRLPVIEAGIERIGKETDRRWEQGEDISLLESETTRYTREETDRLIADPTLQAECCRVSIRALAKQAGVSENTVKAARRGERLRRGTVERLKLVLRNLRS